MSELPDGKGWQFEPKWDGFRAIAARSGSDIQLVSKSGKPLARYFPEVIEALVAAAESDFILDGELILPLGGMLSFQALQQRLHPAASRIARLSLETPARLMLFDCLRLSGQDLMAKPLDERRTALERFYGHEISTTLMLSPATYDALQASDWLARSGGALDGIIAKQRGAPYLSGERAMLKAKVLRSADCVIGGFRRTADGSGVASLLLGLTNDKGALDHVGFTSGFRASERRTVLARLRPLMGGQGFTGRAPGGPSRWRKAGDTAWEPLIPELVVEVRYDQVTGLRFRHGARFLRWRPDKAASQCTFEQLAPALRPAQLAQLTDR